MIAVVILACGGIVMFAFNSSGQDNPTKDTTEERNFTNKQETSPEKSGEEGTLDDDKSGGDYSDENGTTNQENGGDGNDSEKKETSLVITAQTVDLGPADSGEMTLYRSETDGLRQEWAKIDSRSLNRTNSHSFEDLESGDIYKIKVNSEVFPAENFTVIGGDIEQFVATVGYETRGAKSFRTDFNVTEFGRTENGEVYAETVYIGYKIIDRDGGVYSKYNTVNWQTNPRYRPWESLYHPGYKESYRKTGGLTREGWYKPDANYSREAQDSISDRVVYWGLSQYENRTYLAETRTKDGELRHKYQIKDGIVHVNPDSGYITYLNTDVSKIEDVKRAESWYSQHDQDLNVIPEDFKPPEE